MSPQITISLGEAVAADQLAPGLKVLALLTVLSLAPAILISMTSFTRIVIVMSFVRQALGTQSTPPTQVVMALSLLLTFVVMAPVARRLDAEVLAPYQAKTLDDQAALGAASSVLRDFLLPQTRQSDLLLFHELTKSEPPAEAKDVAMHLLVPAFMISELRTGFEMGFLVFLPFVLIDLVVASLLTAMGMVMLPPTMLATPLKLLLFVSVDGWALLTRSLITSFQ